MIFRQPAEWEPHTACWTAWPSHTDLWKEDLIPTQRAFVEMCRAIADPDPVGGSLRGERLNILVMPDQIDVATRRLGFLEPTTYHQIPFGDIWLRDTGPIFTRASDGAKRANRFVFNGWGGKYRLPHDRLVAGRIARAWETFHPEGRILKHPWVFEGGAVDVDGCGTGLTTEQCLLHPNRNPRFDKRMLESCLREALGIERLLWITRGLVNDHTDGHVDNIARFVQPGVVLCMESRSLDDPNREILKEVRKCLQTFRDANGQRLHLIAIPSPGRIEDTGGRVMPASYLNFYIGNRVVVMPTFGSPHDDKAGHMLAACFEGRTVVGIEARTMLTGGGAFHCITQQEPRS